MPAATIQTSIVKYLFAASPVPQKHRSFLVCVSLRYVLRQERTFAIRKTLVAQDYTFSCLFSAVGCRGDSVSASTPSNKWMHDVPPSGPQKASSISSSCRRSYCLARNNCLFLLCHYRSGLCAAAVAAVGQTKCTHRRRGRRMCPPSVFAPQRRHRNVVRPADACLLEAGFLSQVQHLLVGGRLGGE